MWEFIKSIITAPYNLYCTIRNIKTEVKSTLQDPLINYEQMYNNIFAAKQEESQKYYKYLDTIKAEHDKTMRVLQKQYDKAKEDKIEIQLKYDGMVQQIQSMVMENNLKASTITKLTKEKEEVHKQYVHECELKMGLQKELLEISQQLQKQLTVTDQEVINRATKLQYASPTKTRKLQVTLEQLTLQNTDSTKALTLIQNEFDKVYSSDVQLSEKLISYTKDLTKVMTDLTKFNTQYSTIRNKVEETRHKLISIEAEINSYATIKQDLGVKSMLNATDLDQLRERLQDLQQVEKQRNQLLVELDTYAKQESYLKSKVEEHTILYAKRNELIITQIQTWIHQRAEYYVSHNMPFGSGEQNKDKLINFVRTLEEKYKALPNNPWQVDQLHANYNYKEYKYHIDQKAVAVIERHKPAILKSNNTQHLIPRRQPQELPPAISKLSVSETFEKLQKSHKVYNSIQEEELNAKVLRSISVPINQSRFGLQVSKPPYTPRSTSTTTSVPAATYEKTTIPVEELD